jgi:hypothetical protein
MRDRPHRFTAAFSGSTLLPVHRQRVSCSHPYPGGGSDE